MLRPKKFEYFSIKRIKLKSLMIKKIRINGRNSGGKIVLRYRGGGGVKKFYRFVDFFRKLYNIPAIVRSFVYDPNRNIYLSLLYYINGIFSYILTPVYLNIGDFVISGFRVLLQNGNNLPLVYVPLGTLVNGVSFFSKDPSKIARAAGTSIQLLKRFLNYILIRLPSGEERLVGLFNFCSIGALSGSLNKLYRITKAGNNIRAGRKSAVRGVAKNPVDHPHGGGEGRTTAAQPSVSPWGVYTKGTRSTTKFIRYNKINTWKIFRRRNWKSLK
jgi:large subunit ribosomal protein L2